MDIGGYGLWPVLALLALGVGIGIGYLSHKGRQAKAVLEEVESLVVRVQHEPEAETEQEIFTEEIIDPVDMPTDMLAAREPWKQWIRDALADKWYIVPGPRNNENCRELQNPSGRFASVCVGPDPHINLWDLVSGRWGSTSPPYSYEKIVKECQNPRQY